MAEKMELSIDDYNKLIINNWNDVISKKDKIIVIGKVGTNNLRTIKEILNSLNGKKFLADYSSNTFCSKGLWKWAGFYPIWDVELRYETIINNKKSTVWISNKERELQENNYYLVGNNISKETDFNKRIINISLENWDMTPLEMNATLQLLQDYYYENGGAYGS